MMRSALTSICCKVYLLYIRSIADILFLVKAFFHHSADFSADFSPFCPIAA
ncbi:hypothetical protein FAEPRAA2165_02856 [Faecalibacterium duncaniae]|uniref:Uncharacterized protein n=1 Tax=Faecalibacterium duncaniae (strain DSM 17677 / JCM 31915 / A2-165) TaxID=411483 RepID=C7H960_FAED2|nr:hypothetical protein FAEPRAA2165_02856 [Faecalibacterium duncaniae]